MKQWFSSRQGILTSVTTLLLLLLLLNSQKGLTPEGLIRHQTLVFGPISMNLIFSHDTGASADAQTIVEAVISTVHEVNSLMSAHLPESEISQINRLAPGTSMTVSPLTWLVLMESRRYFLLSNGAFDPSVGPLIQLFKFKKPGKEHWVSESLPNQEAIDAARILTGCESAFTYQTQGRRVTRLIEGATLDLGAIAKGFAVDQAIDVLKRFGISKASVEIGGEIRLLGNHPEGRSWQTAIQHPDKPDNQTAYLFRLNLEDTAVATSGNYQQYIEFEGKRYSHIIDPRSGMPVQSPLTGVTILAPTCLKADALATAVSVLGETEGRIFLEQFTDCTAFFQTRMEDGEIRVSHWGSNVPAMMPEDP